MVSALPLIFIFIFDRVEVRLRIFVRDQFEPRARNKMADKILHLLVVSIFLYKTA